MDGGMKTDEPIQLTRDCEAIQIPSGNVMTLPKGTLVRVRQSLGGTYTVVTDDGWMVRISSKDADALGEKKDSAASSAESQTPSLTKEEIEKRVGAQLRTVFDPEIPVNVVDLGLIYLCEVAPIPEGGYSVHVKMTLTAPGCGMGSVLQADAQGKIFGIPGVKRANVEMVIDPPWNPSRMSEAAKLQLGML